MSKRQMLKHYKIIKNELRSSQNIIEQLNEKIEQLEETQQNYKEYLSNYPNCSYQEESDGSENFEQHEQNYQEEDFKGNFDCSYQEESDGSEDSEQHEQTQQNYQEQDLNNYSDCSDQEMSDGSEDSKQDNHEDSSNRGNENSKEYDHDLDNSNEECEHCENMKKLLNKAKTMQTNHSDRLEKVTHITNKSQNPIESYSNEIMYLIGQKICLKLKIESLNETIEQKEKEIAKINKRDYDDIQEMKRKYKIYSNDETNQINEFFDKLKLYLQCPITLQQLKDPVLSPSGNTIEKSVMENLISTQSTDPFTRIGLCETITPNLVVTQILELHEKYRLI